MLDLVLEENPENKVCLAYWSCVCMGGANIGVGGMAVKTGEAEHINKKKGGGGCRFFQVFFNEHTIEIKGRK